MYQKHLHRLILLIDLLQSGQRYGIDALATECEVSRRTVFRDLGTLRDCGVPVLIDRETGHYYLSGRTGLLKSVDFSPEEALSLIVLTSEISNSGGVPFLSPARSAVLKIQSILPPGLRDDVGELTGTIRIRFEPSYDKLDDKAPMYERLIEAMNNRHAVRIHYKSPAEPDLICTKLHPYRLLFSRRSWYVIGRSSLHAAVRTFHLGRVLQLEELDEVYEIPRSFTIERYLRNAWHIIPEEGPDQTVVVRFSPVVAQNVAEVNWHKTQEVVHNEDGSIDYRVTVSGLGEIMWWILGYGDQAVVLEPPELRERIKWRIDRMLENYKRQ